MSHFHLLHPSLQHQIVNALGWHQMRPFQDAAIAPLLAGEHRIILAPTAGGKTEAAFFPILSRMLTESWTGLSVLYLCPIKALLNNLDSRLSRYCSLVGRTSALWHGDVGPSERKAILREPPDVLLTTPESLEVMLVSSRVDERVFFSGLRAVIIDEIHAFAGDDRGWHLLSVLERVQRCAGREIQRIGLSATVGNPTDLLAWLTEGCVGPKAVSYPPAPSTQDPIPPEPQVQIDHVGSLHNAAIVISRLHQGEKRLVFMDSRAKAEELGLYLRELGVSAFVTHSSLSQDQRRQAEHAFATRQDCVIVATSVLELGIDVGDLDRVIQIDSPATVSSFLQRMGRTGRRPGTVRNCLFLTISDHGLLQASALVDLWKSGYVEPVLPPVRPEHVLAQQLMALVLQERGIGKDLWFSWVAHVPAFAQMGQEKAQRIMDSMLAKAILWEEAGILGMGEQGEKEFGKRNFMALLSVFLSSPLFTVLAGRKEIGSVDESTFWDGSGDGQAKVLLLGGSAWKVNHIDWEKKLAFVEPTDNRGRSRWRSQPPGLRFGLSQAIYHLITSRDQPCHWSQRAKSAWETLRAEHCDLERGKTLLEHTRAGYSWWTFAGAGANASLTPRLSHLTQLECRCDSFAIHFKGEAKPGALANALETVQKTPPEELFPHILPEARRALKFGSCLEPDRVDRILAERLREIEGIFWVQKTPVKFLARA